MFLLDAAFVRLENPPALMPRRLCSPNSTLPTVHDYPPRLPPQQMQESALHHVRRCQPGSGIGYQNFIQRAGGGGTRSFGAGELLLLSIAEFHGTPTFA